MKDGVVAIKRGREWSHRISQRIDCSSKPESISSLIRYLCHAGRGSEFSASVLKVNLLPFYGRNAFSCLPQDLGSQLTCPVKEVCFQESAFRNRWTLIQFHIFVTMKHRYDCESEIYCRRVPLKNVCLNMSHVLFRKKGIHRRRQTSPG